MKGFVIITENQSLNVISNDEAVKQAKELISNGEKEVKIYEIVPHATVTKGNIIYKEK